LLINLVSFPKAKEAKKQVLPKIMKMMLKEESSKKITINRLGNLPFVKKMMIKCQENPQEDHLWMTVLMKMLPRCNHRIIPKDLSITKDLRDQAIKDLSLIRGLQIIKDLNLIRGLLIVLNRIKDLLTVLSQ
jgi:hypothetical protein